MNNKEAIPMRTILRRLSRRHTTAVAYHLDEDGDARVVESTPADTGTGWTVLVHNDGSSPFEAYAWATCAYFG